MIAPPFSFCFWADVALTRARLMLSVPRVSLFSKLVRTLAHIEQSARRASQDPDYDMHDDADGLFLFHMHSMLFDAA